MAAAAVAMLMLASLPATSLAAVRSPGCVAWNALGVAGWTNAVETIPGPFVAGETLRYTIDDNSVGDAFYLMTSGFEIIFTASSPGPQTFVVPTELAEVSFNGTGSPPATWFLSHFSCSGVAEPPPTDTLDVSAPTRQDGDSRLAWLLLIVAGALLVAGRDSRRARSKRR